MAEITFEQATHLNRHERRRLAKINGVAKIPGANKPIVNPYRQVKKYKKKHQDDDMH